MRRLALISLVAVVLFAACGGSSATQQSGAGGNPTSAAGGNATPKAKATPTKGQASGTGSVTVTLGGSSYTVKDGDCATSTIGGKFFVAEFGDWINGIDPESTVEFVSIDIYPDGHAERGGGYVGGIRFFLNTTDQKGTGDVNNGGTFSGTDAYGHGAVTGTFTCK